MEKLKFKKLDFKQNNQGHQDANVFDPSFHFMYRVFKEQDNKIYALLNGKDLTKDAMGQAWTYSSFEKAKEACQTDFEEKCIDICYSIFNMIHDPREFHNDQLLSGTKK